MRWITLHSLVTAVTIIVYILSSHLLQQRRHPSAAIAWMLFIVLLPYLALPLFLSFGSRKIRQVVPPRLNIKKPGLENEPWAIVTIEALGLESPATYDELVVHKDGRDAKRALVELISEAQLSIELCTYLLGRDRLGAEVIDLLCSKAENGITVRILLDGLSHIICLRSDLKKLKKSGAQCLTFVPPIGSPLKGRSNLRNHRKLILADANTTNARMWCGGRNLSAEYFEGADNSVPWRDLSFDLRGPLVMQAWHLFEQDWYFARHFKVMLPGPALSNPYNKLSTPHLNDVFRPIAQLVPSGPDRTDDTLHALLLTACYQARESIALVTPYFVPDAALLMALCMAARRGVQVDLLLPARSNHRLSDFARNRSIRALFLAGGRIWYSDQMQHAKLIIVDEALALAGSANIDNRSLFINYELMVAFHSRPDILTFKAWLEAERICATSFVPVKPSLRRDLAEGMILWLGFQL
jgi:cardiolipin synthase A/B